MEPEPQKHVDHDPGEFAAFGPFLLLPGARRLQRDSKPVEIGGRALDLLIELVRQAGRVVSHAELLSAIWADTTVVAGVLRTHVCSLRKTLGDGVAGARYVTSVAGRGYCFVAPVVRSAAEARPPASPNAWQLAHGLPPRLGRMAGRDDAVRKLAAQLAQHRFVTVLGAAGIGKTTVAVAVGHALLNDFGGAVRFIELGSLTDPALVAPTVASTLGVSIQNDDALESLRAFLQDKRVLLVLDNCEQVVDTAARLAEHLFLRAPRLHLLMTSREALRAEGEYHHRLGPLETPTEVLSMDADTVQTFPAVQVFLERAAASGWSGELTDGDVPIVAETCRRLDGVPLAIELAASFVGRYGLHGIAALLNDRTRLLRQRGRRTAPPRQQTIHALIAWSYDRLPEHERVVLRRLSVFVGTFAFDAAKAVALEAGESAESLPGVINELVAKSLLSVSVEESVVVYRLLETTRVYALERLVGSGEFERVSLCHAAFFADRLGCANSGPGQETFRARASDLANVRAALQRSFSSPSGPTAAARLAAAATRMLLELGLVSECHHWCRRALDIIEVPDVGTLVELGLQEALALSAMITTGLDSDVHGALTRGLEIARALGSGDHEIRLLGHLTIVLLHAGDFRGALDVAEQSRPAIHQDSVAGAMMAHCMLGAAHVACGNRALGQEHCEASLRLAAAFPQPQTMFTGRSHAVLTLARALWLQGRPDRAATVARQVANEAATTTHAAEKALRLTYCEMIFAWRGEWREAGRLLDLLTEHADRYSLSLYRGVAMALRGELLVKTGQPLEGCSLLRLADLTLTAMHNTSLDTYVACALAEGLAATGSFDQALTAIEGAIELARRRGGTWDLPELLRLKGIALASRSPTDARAVDETLSSAIDLARRQGALAWELRATISLARERLRRGGSADVLGDLSAVYARFTEGMETPDLQAAGRLLEQAR